MAFPIFCRGCGNLIVWESWILFIDLTLKLNQKFYSILTICISRVVIIWLRFFYRFRLKFKIFSHFYSVFFPLLEITRELWWRNLESTWNALRCWNFSLSFPWQGLLCIQWIRYFVLMRKFLYKICSFRGWREEELLWYNWVSSAPLNWRLRHVFVQSQRWFVLIVHARTY